MADRSPRSPEAWLSLRQVCVRTGASRNTVYRAVWSGDLEAEQLGGYKKGQWRVHVDKCDQWAKGHHAERRAS